MSSGESPTQSNEAVDASQRRREIAYLEARLAALKAQDTGMPADLSAWDEYARLRQDAP